MVVQRRSEEFFAFLEHVAGGIEPGTDVHVTLDYVSTHKSAMANEWQNRRPHWMFHFSLTSASWTNTVEGFFFHLSWQRLKQMILNSLDE